MIESAARRFSLSLAILALTVLSAYGKDGDGIPASLQESLITLEQSAGLTPVPMADLEASFQTLLSQAESDAERALIYRYLGNVYFVRDHFAEALPAYRKSQEFAPENMDPTQSVVPYRVDTCRAERIYQSIGMLAPACLIACVVCGCLFLRFGRWNLRAIIGLVLFVGGWLILSYGLMRYAEMTKVPIRPDTEGYGGEGEYIFVFLGPATNPVFWRFVAWSGVMLVFYWLMAINRKANRFSTYTVLPALLILSALSAYLVNQCFYWFPSRYEAAKLPLLNPVVLAKGQVDWLRPMLLACIVLVAVACIVASLVALRKKKEWVHRPCQFLAALTSAVALVALFQLKTRTDFIQATPEACYYEGAEIEALVHKYPQSFVNLNADDAETEELRDFILENTPIVPEELYDESRRDDAK